MKVLRQGARNNEVVQLQILLNAHLNPTIKLKNDGFFGRNTEDAVKAFQRAKGLVSDGVVGAKTWQSLTKKIVNNVTKPLEPLNATAAWYDIAVAEIGVKELLGIEKNNQRIIEYHSTTTLGAKTDEIPWCSSFVNWVMRQAGFEGTNNALAKSWLDWGSVVTTPQKGDVVVIKRKNATNDARTGSSSGYHVGFYVTSSNVVISLLGGNQSNSVKKSNFMLRSYDIAGFRRPKRRVLGLPLSVHSFIKNVV
ncbi:TIGR02594 family protein [Teredinibacter turnerae]|uniref:NlpC/P60 family protein n=1 Tax=Teredinibacter turnerae TaxID=2426 RepID=UPI00040EA966|nr:TIGR02594 family protein [Teredinibacter turnerae]